VTPWAYWLGFPIPEAEARTSARNAGIQFAQNITAARKRLACSVLKVATAGAKLRKFRQFCRPLSDLQRKFNSAILSDRGASSRFAQFRATFSNYPVDAEVGFVDSYEQR
jgi:hypothetical protein